VRLATVGHDLVENRKITLDVTSIDFEMREQVGVSYLPKCDGEFLAVAPTPRPAPCQSHELSFEKRNAVSHETSIVGLLLENGERNLVRERSRLSVLWIESDREMLFLVAAIKFDPSYTRSPASPAASQVLAMNSTSLPSCKISRRWRSGFCATRRIEYLRWLRERNENSEPHRPATRQKTSHNPRADRVRVFRQRRPITVADLS
jgi:hypothetical protein